ncbi:cholecystokinin-like [Gouania willdenowi]|uniref:cholecystokinin-like n=1 Tax=Gouania willdenowi TaxID=441366 RepID=UPI00105695FC|nr:cholecystokinin-like [Gouania willdenowi]
MRSESQVLLTDNLQPSYSLNRSRQARSAPPSGELSNYNQRKEISNVPNRLSQMLARILSRTRSPYQTRSSISSRASGLAPDHRIHDRDYMGWMDFGRRSAEEYEYSS